jgi:hypothetical protein
LDEILGWAWCSVALKNIKRGASGLGPISLFFIDFPFRFDRVIDDRRLEIESLVWFRNDVNWRFGGLECACCWMRLGVFAGLVVSRCLIIRMCSE